MAVVGNAFFAGVVAAGASFLCLTLSGCALAAYGLGVATMANDSVVRHEMRLARSGADDEIVGEAGDLAQIEDPDVFRFFVRGGLGCRKGDGFGVGCHAGR